MAKVLALTLALSTAVSAMELTPETWDDAVAGKTGAKTRGGGRKAASRARASLEEKSLASCPLSGRVRARARFSRAVFIKFLAPW